MTATSRAYPELISLPRSTRYGIAHLHVAPATLTPKREHFCRSQDYRTAEVVSSRSQSTTELRTTIRGMVTGIILAAGRSTRMGTSQALLIAPDGRTVVARLAEELCYGGVHASLVVGREDDDLLRAEVETIGCGVGFVVNADADEGGQLSSLL